MFGKSLVQITAVAWLAVVLSCGNGTPLRRIRISGNIELTEVNLAFKIPGQLIELTVDEGDRVEEGDLIARLDSEQLERQRDAAIAGLKSARSRQREVEALIAFQTASVEAQIQERRAILWQAETRLEKVESGSRVQEIEEAEAAVSRAKADHDRASSDWKRAELLFRNEDISANQHDQFRAALGASAATLRQAEERFALIEEGPRREDLEIARHAVAQARAGLEVAESRRLEIRRNVRSLDTIQAEIEAAEAEIGLLESRLGDMLIVSPISGVVLSKVVEESEVIAAGTPVVTVGDLDHPWMRGYVMETHLGMIKLGDRVEVTSDSFPGKTYSGIVSFISSEAEFTPKQIQTTEERVKMVYRFKVNLDNPEQELKLNMPVDGVILLQTEETR